jgi:hypothetical protein
VRIVRAPHGLEVERHERVRFVPLVTDREL